MFMTLRSAELTWSAVKPKKSRGRTRRKMVLMIVVGTKTMRDDIAPTRNRVASDTTDSSSLLDPNW